MNTLQSKPTGNLDGRVFWPSVVFILAIVIPIILFPQSSSLIIQRLFNFVTLQFGWLYLAAGLAVVVFLLWLAFGRYGQVKLGRAEDTPEFSYFSWVAMIFCCGIGIAIANWAWVEPIYYFSGHPLGAEAKSQQAAEWALAYGQFHWGLTPWAFYCLPSLPIAWCLYVRRQPGVRLSLAARGLLGRHADGALGSALDIAVVFGIVGGVGTSLGLAVPLVSTLTSSVFGVTASFTLDLAILALWTALFGTSVWFGLKKGIRVLSDINVYLALLMLAFVFAIGPSLFIINGWTNSLGLMVNNFVHMSLWTDPIAKGSFTRDWTVFYWAWWIAYAPMVGLFAARISRGRSIRELILAQLFWGSLGCWVFFAVWGGYALDLQLSGQLDLISILEQQGIPATILAILQSMPFARGIIFGFIVLCFIFLATTLDSSAYVLASVTSRGLAGDEEPRRWIRMVWALLLALVGVGLIKTGSLKPVQTSSIIVGLPMIAVLFVLALSMLRMLKTDCPQSTAKVSHANPSGI